MSYRHPAISESLARTRTDAAWPGSSTSRAETADGPSASGHTEGRCRVEMVINDYISRELVQDPALLPLANETSLLENGILDSLSVLELLVFLEDQFGITMDDADLLPENFANVNNICAYLRAHGPGEQGAAHG
jgi:acyl carrier protein